MWLRWSEILGCNILVQFYWIIKIWRCIAIVTKRLYDYKVREIWVYDKALYVNAGCDSIPSMFHIALLGNIELQDSKQSVVPFKKGDLVIVKLQPHHLKTMPNKLEKKGILEFSDSKKIGSLHTGRNYGLMLKFMMLFMLHWKWKIMGKSLEFSFPLPLDFIYYSPVTYMG